MKLSEEQQKVITACKNKESDIIKVEAVSGAGKTATLLEIIKECKPKNSMYLAYNQKIAKEASSKFPSSVKCSTVHSLAYREIVPHIKLKIGNPKWFHIRAAASQEVKSKALWVIEQFCVSKFISIDTFVEHMVEQKKLAVLDEKTATIIKETMKKMQAGTIECSHNFYLKLFHLALYGKRIKIKKQDIIMIDEAGDLNSVTLEIFLLLDAELKVLVGDRQQNIYSFNSTINGFEALKDRGKLFSMTQSYRVGSHIAKKIEPFCQTYLNEDMSFKGVQYSEQKEESIAYIARGNSSIVGLILSMIEQKKPYNLTRKASTMFDLVTLLSSLKKGVKSYKEEYKVICEDTENYYDSVAIQAKFSSPLKYVLSEHADDPSIMAAGNIIRNYGPKKIFEAYADAKKHEAGSTKHKITLTTAHSSKGLEWDTVIIADDLNASLDKVIKEYDLDNPDYSKRIPLSVQAKEEFRLYYVACTRAKYSLKNAKHLLAGDTIDLYTANKNMR